MTGFNLAARTVTSPGDGVLVQTPIYFPILSTPGFFECTLDGAELSLQKDGSYATDFEAFEAAITERTRIFILCNPHNPVGRVFRRDELLRMAEICVRHDIVICSDEIHCDLLLGGSRHLPIASLAPEIADRAITLMAPTKTFNIAGIRCSVAIVENNDLRKRFTVARSGIVPTTMGALDYAATLAAFRDGQPWLTALLCYLEDNCDFVLDYVNSKLPGISMARPEGTYLAWLNGREAGLPGIPHEFFLEQARVAMNDGAVFGAGGEGFVRLNFGCPRSTLAEALHRMREALLAL
jgi:cystathionine beta-lyase